MRCPELALVLVLSGCDAAPVGEDVSPPDDVDLQAVQAWLFDGEYLEWERHEGESGARVYLSPKLAASLDAGGESHPIGSAAVRELVDAQDPARMIGWAYMHKLDDGAGADGWFFYEVFSLAADGAPQVAERGAAGCVGCHQDGVDFIQTRP